MASGAIIRILSPLLTDKHTEPPVLVMDELCNHIIPLLGGHHGANKLASELASKLGITPAITTAGELRFSIALDDPPEGWILSNPENYKSFMSSLLGGASVALQEQDCRADWLHHSQLPFASDSKLQIKATIYKSQGDDSTLVYHPKSLVLGMGCERGIDSTHTISLVESILKESNLARQSLSLLTSIDIKSDEQALHETAAHFHIPIRFFPAETLEQERHRLANPSSVVFDEVGCHGVSEGSSLSAVGDSGTLKIEKTKGERSTAAICHSEVPIDAINIGVPRGHLSVIGIGPGSDDWCSPEATRLISQAQDLVGYTLYLDLLGEKTKDRELHNFPLGKEEDRVRHALELAGTGRNVALICSGDAGIYAMASLVFELLDKGDLSQEAQRVSLQVSPGISALQAASALSGAPLGHDLCTISLSDLLTPWEHIERRIHSAATADFVIAFYNPVSQRRRHQLAKAKEILLTARDAETPVVLASNLGRESERITLTTLSSLQVDDVDMLTLVLVGSTTSRRYDSPSGKSWIYTPRGYTTSGYGEKAGRL